MLFTSSIRRRTLLKGAAGLTLAVAAPALSVRADDPPGPVARYMDSIWHRPQDGGDFTITSSRGLQGGNVEAFVVSYRSYNLKITGLMCMPVGQGNGPWPVLLINHGHFAFNAYDTGYDTLREDLFFASNGYVTIASDYRNYAGSDKGEYQLEPGYTYDVRNLLDAIRFVAPVDAHRVGMMGHSMGGGITQEVLVNTQGQIKAATLYGSVSGDEVDNYTARHTFWRGQASPSDSARRGHGDGAVRPAGPNRRGVPPHVADQLSGSHRLPGRHPSLRCRTPSARSHGRRSCATPSPRKASPLNSIPIRASRIHSRARDSRNICKRISRTSTNTSKTVSGRMQVMAGLRLPHCTSSAG